MQPIPDVSPLKKKTRTKKKKQSKRKVAEVEEAEIEEAEGGDAEGDDAEAVDAEEVDELSGTGMVDNPVWNKYSSRVLYGRWMFEKTEKSVL